ncbi:hypothetical protein BJ508DRAFT_417179 [Ascobolus immersus RN42]|uniref:Uncharacterized protein n=1 Tax=Ascobolus immersus RN42 TaxID=1160509 RepID=A0A3N4HZ95_ASCIM|nr:hypothetical protein BJ508DRAFT_417179 [Ascobolus immersus RN42]
MTSLVSDIHAIFVLTRSLRERFKKGPSAYRKTCATLTELEDIIIKVETLFDPESKGLTEHTRVDSAQQRRLGAGRMVGRQTDGSNPSTATDVGTVVSRGNSGGSPRLGIIRPQDRITEVVDDSDDSDADEHETEEKPTFIAKNSSLGRALEEHIGTCYDILHEFEERARSWEEAIALAPPRQRVSPSSRSSMRSPQKSLVETGWKRITNLASYTQKSVAASIEFSAKDMLKYVNDIREHIKAIGIYIELSTAESQKRTEKTLQNVERTATRIEKKQERMFHVLCEFVNASYSSGVPHMVSGSHWGAIPTVEILGTMGWLPYLPIAACRTPTDIFRSILSRLGDCRFLEASIVVNGSWPNIELSELFASHRSTMYRLYECKACGDAFPFVPVEPRRASPLAIHPGDKIELATVISDPSGTYDFAITAPCQYPAHRTLRRVYVRDPSRFFKQNNGLELASTHKHKCNEPGPGERGTLSMKSLGEFADQLSELTVPVTTTNKMQILEQVQVDIAIFITNRASEGSELDYLSYYSLFRPSFISCLLNASLKLGSEGNESFGTLLSQIFGSERLDGSTNVDLSNPTVYNKARLAQSRHVRSGSGFICLNTQNTPEE